MYRFSLDARAQGLQVGHVPMRGVEKMTGGNRGYVTFEAQPKLYTMVIILRI